MTSRQQTTLAASLLLAGFLAASIPLLQTLDRTRAAAPVEEVLYISSPKILKRLSLGYGGLLADVYWTRVVQYFGAKHHVGARNYALLAPLLEITTELDPHLLVAYDFGANFLAPNPPDGAGMPDAAIKLVQHGIENNPQSWRLYYQLGFIYYMQLKDYSAAANAFARGSEVPNAHPFMKVLASQMAQHAGDAQMARALWSTTFNTTNDKLIRANAVAHLRAIDSDEAVKMLEEITAKFHAQTGRFPATFNDLLNAGMIRALPIDPAGHPYKLLPEGKIEVAVPDEIPFIQRGLPPGYQPPAKTKLLPAE